MKRIVARLPALLAPLLLLGCRTGPAPVAPIDEARRLAIVAEQSRRLSLLDRIDRAGTGTLRVRDDDGAVHDDQGDIRLLLERPDRAAIRLSVLGETVAWLGCDAELAWVFSLRDRDDRWCAVGEHALLGEDIGLALPPAALFDMLGLVELPDDPAAWSTDPDGRPVVRTLGAAGALVLALDSLGLPVRIVALDAADRPVLESELEEYQSIETRGVPSAGLPRFPGRAVIRRADGAVELRLSLEAPPVALPEARWNAAFDFETLLAQLRPDRIDDRRAPRDDAP